MSTHHYATHLQRTDPRISAGVINAGTAKTDILRMQPPPMRATAKLLEPLLFDSGEKSAHNPSQAALREDWGKTGYFEQQTPYRPESGHY